MSRIIVIVLAILSIFGSAEKAIRSHIHPATVMVAANLEPVPLTLVMPGLTLIQITSIMIITMIYGIMRIRRIISRKIITLSNY